MVKLSRTVCVLLAMQVVHQRSLEAAEFTELPARAAVVPKLAPQADIPAPIPLPQGRRGPGREAPLLRRTPGAHFVAPEDFEGSARERRRDDSRGARRPPRTTVA